MRIVIRYAAFSTFVSAASLAATLLLINVSNALSTHFDAEEPAPAVSAPADILEPALAPSSSLNWAGYVADTAASYTYVTGTWTVPSVTASPGDSADATWVGIGGVKSHDLIQAGTEAISTPSAGPGQASDIYYQAWYELLPGSSQPVPLTVRAGDSVTVSVAQKSEGLWLISFSNNTTGKSYSQNVAYDSSRSSAEWIEEMPAAVRARLGLDQFGAVHFSSGYAISDGSAVSIADSHAGAISMSNASGQRLATPSVIGSDGTRFTVTRTSAVATPVTLDRENRAGALATNTPINESYGYSHRYRGLGIRVGDGQWIIISTF